MVAKSTKHHEETVERIPVPGIADAEIHLFTRGDLKKPTIYYRLKVQGMTGFECKSTKTTDLDTAKQRARKRYAALSYEHDQLGRTSHPKSFEAVARSYLKWLKEQVDGGRTNKERLSNHKAQLGHTLIKRFGKKAVDAIKEKDLVDYQDWRITVEKRADLTDRKPVSVNTVTAELGTLRAVMVYAAQKGIMDRSHIPTHGWGEVKPNPRPAFTRDEISKLRDAMPSWINAARNSVETYRRMRGQALLTTLAFTGMRVGEAKQLLWGNVLTTRNGVTLAVKKGKRGKRDVHPMPEAVEALDAWRTYQHQWFQKEPQPADLVFCDHDGTALEDHEQIFRAMYAHAGLEKDISGAVYTAYSLRHFYATDRLEQDVQALTVANQLGSSVKMLQDYYSHVSSKAAKKQIEKGNDEMPQATAMAELKRRVAKAKDEGY